MKKNRLLHLLLLLLSLTALGQNATLSRLDYVNQSANELIAKKTDTICVYETFDENKQPSHTHYIFWRSKGKTKVQKIDPDKANKITEVPMDAFWQNLFSNIELVKNEEARMYQYEETADDKKEINTIITEVGDIAQFSVFLNGDITEFWLNRFDLKESDETNNKKTVNINAEFNNSLKGKQILDQLNEITMRLEKK